MLVARHPAVREGLARVLASDPDFRVVAQAESAEQALRLTSRDPDVVVLELRLPGMGGLELCARLGKARPEFRIVALASDADPRAMLGAFEAGADGLLLERSNPSVIRDSIRTAVRGRLFVDPGVGTPLPGMTRALERGRRGLRPR